ncbi:golgin subfamily A member 6-like protein 2, partial [Siniperca chuatsi]|uniref:golgin subfamily A member 6-like protein 2 n=1 Tax=Siniperca chuatsi TaxID=119488 RepID=UPI001CE1FE63
VPVSGADGVDRPFPNKPVSHRRPLNPRTQDSLDLYDFEKITITKQPRGTLPPQEHHSNGIRETNGSQHPRKDSDKLPRGELQMARAIHAKELILQEKLWRVEEKIRQKISRDYIEAAAGEEERHNRAEREKAQTKTRLFEQQRRDPVRSREMMMQERRQEDVKQLRKRQDQRNENRMRNTHEEEGARWKRGEIEFAQLQRKGHKGSHEITVHEQEVSGELNKSRWENVKEHTRRKGGNEKDNGIWGETGVTSQEGPRKAKERVQNTTSMGNKGWTREKKYKERTCKEMCGSDYEQDMPQMSQQKTSHRAAAENHRGAGRKLSGETLLPPVSSHSSRPEQGELRLIDSTDTGLQLLPCRICNRKFASERLEKHVQICKKVKQSHRQVFNSYINRTKGSAIEEFWKTHSRTKTPEVLKKNNLRQNHKASTRTLHEGRLPAGNSQSKWSK